MSAARNSCPKLPNRLRRELIGWWASWGMPKLADTVVISYSSRLFRTFARCRPLNGSIVIREDLAQAPYTLLAEVVCHELAHLANYRLHGSNVKPHGREWQELVRIAGFEPRIRIENAQYKKKAANRDILPKYFEHRCPVCATVRVARRRVAVWRCAICLDSGRDGKMNITRRASISRNNNGH